MKLLPVPFLSHQYWSIPLLQYLGVNQVFLPAACKCSDSSFHSYPKISFMADSVNPDAVKTHLLFFQISPRKMAAICVIPRILLIGVFGYRWPSSVWDLALKHSLFPLPCWSFYPFLIFRTPAVFLPCMSQKLQSTSVTVPFARCFTMWPTWHMPVPSICSSKRVFSRNRFFSRVLQSVYSVVTSKTPRMDFWSLGNNTFPCGNEMFSKHIRDTWLNWCITSLALFYFFKLLFRSIGNKSSSKSLNGI